MLHVNVTIENLRFDFTIDAIMLLTIAALLWL